MFGYEIKSGVRRSVAAYAAGKGDIAAVIVHSHNPDIVTRIKLTLLYSPKVSIQRDYRYIRGSEYPTAILDTEPPPIEVEEILVPDRIQHLTAIADVRLT